MKYLSPILIGSTITIITTTTANAAEPQYNSTPINTVTEYAGQGVQALGETRGLQDGQPPRGLSLEETSRDSPSSASPTVNTSPTATIIANAPEINYLQIANNVAANKAIPINLFNGHISSIDFSDSDEIITFAEISDRSRLVFNTDQPIETNQAQTVFLLPIQQINFPGATTSPHPNVVIQTISPNGETKLYNFIVHFKPGTISSLGIKIIKAAPAVTIPDTRFQISYGDAGVTEVEQGLKLALAKGFTTPQDEVVGKVREFIFDVRNGSSIPEALEKNNLPGRAIESLAELAIETTEAQIPNQPIEEVTNETTIAKEPLEKLLEKAPITKRVTENIILGNNLFFYLQKQVENQNIQRHSEEYQKIKKSITEIKRGKNLTQALKDNDVSINWLTKIQGKLN